ESGRGLTLIGLDVVSLVAHFPSEASPLLQLDLAGAASTEVMLRRVLDDLADLALAAWPVWPPLPAGIWRRAADRLAANGHRPRFNRLSIETQFDMLYPCAGQPALLFQSDVTLTEQAAMLIAALEWTCRRGARALLLLPRVPSREPPWD